MLFHRTPKPATRERWLITMVDHLSRLIEAKGLSLPAELFIESDLIHYEKNSRSVLGQCLHADNTVDGRPQIYISPDQNKPVQIAETILHELLHAGLPAEVNHSAPFVKYAKRLGLRVLSPDGHTDLTPALEQHIKFLVRVIGPYPPRQSAPARMPLPPSADYPRMLFHRTQPPVIVASRASEAALGKEWSRSPWSEDASAAPPVDWVGAWLKSQGFPKSYYHRDTDEERIVRNPDEERILADSGLWMTWKRYRR